MKKIDFCQTEFYWLINGRTIGRKINPIDGQLIPRGESSDGIN